MRRTLSLWIALASAACATPRSRAARAFERGEYFAAAERYSVLLEQAPDDASLRAGRDEARARVLVTLADRVRQLRTAGQPEPALAALADLLAQRHLWSDTPDAAGATATAAIAAEVTAAGAYLTGQIQPLAERQPLAAEDAIASRRSQLGSSELDPLWSMLDAAVQRGAHAICSTAGPDDAERSPYLARLASTYCAHFGITARPPERLPAGVAGVSTTGDIAGLTAEQRARLDAALDELLRKTAWFDARGQRRAVVALDGGQAVAYSSRAVSRTTAYAQTVTYVDREVYQEPYQEAYQESYQEPYTIDIPYTERKTETYSCGPGSLRTCTRPVQSTKYRSELRYRTAQRTAYRLAHRTASRDVTRTRLEPRTYSFAATERAGSYSGAWTLTFDLGGDAPPLELDVIKADRRVGYDHDVQFAPANLAPSRAHLASLDDWFAELLADLQARFPARLAEHWTTSFCQASSFSPETAARCSYGGHPPDAARAALASLFAGDVDDVIARFAAMPPH